MSVYKLSHEVDLGTWWPVGGMYIIGAPIINK